MVASAHKEAQMNTLPEFFQGSIARDLQEILAAEEGEEK